MCFFGRYKNLEDLSFDIIEIGKTLAEEGYTIISGGFGGTMEQISKGAKLGGGKAIGITCYIFPDVKNLNVNRYVDEEIRTTSLFERIETMMQLSDAFVALPGGTGTLLEISAILDNVNKGLIPFKPIICFGNYWRSIAKPLEDVNITSKTIRKQFKFNKTADLLHFVETIEELITVLNRYS